MGIVGLLGRHRATPTSSGVFNAGRYTASHDEEGDSMPYISFGGRRAENVRHMELAFEEHTGTIYRRQLRDDTQFRSMRPTKKETHEFM